MELHSDINNLDVFVISLDRTPLRYEFVKEQLDMEELPHQKFSAVDGYEIQINNLFTKKTFIGRQLDTNVLYSIDCVTKPQPVVQEGHLMKLLYINNFTPMSAGEFGCACSHRYLWHYVAQNNIKAALILEDDVVLNPNFKENLSKILENLPDDWGIIYLDLDPNNIKTAPYDNYFETVDLISWFYGTYAYLINPQSAKTLLTGSELINYPIDNTIDKLIKQGALKAYKAKEHMLTVLIENSEIASMGSRRNI